MTNMTRQDVLQVLHQHIDGVEIDDCLPNGQPIHLTIDEAYVELTPYSWRVPVRPSREPLWWDCIYLRNAEIAEDIAEETGLNIIFSTWDPLPETAEAETAVAA